MGDETGAAIVLLLSRGGNEQIALVRAMVSLPTYDPNQLNSNFEQLVVDESAPLLNRATQAQYQPGEIISPFLFALEPELLNRLSHENIDLTNTELATRWTREDLLAAWEIWGFNESPAFSLPVADITPPSAADISSIERAISGESTLLMTPLQLALATSALARDGTLPQPRLVTAVQDEGEWVNYGVALTPTAPIIDSAVAEAVQQTMWQATSTGETEYLVYTASVQAGTNQFNHWLIGLVPAQAPRYVVIFIYENNSATVQWDTINQTIDRLADS